MFDSVNPHPAVLKSTGCNFPLPSPEHFLLLVMTSKTLSLVVFCEKSQLGLAWACPVDWPWCLLCLCLLCFILPNLSLVKKTVICPPSSIQSSPLLTIAVVCLIFKEVGFCSLGNNLAGMRSSKFKTQSTACYDSEAITIPTQEKNSSEITLLKKKSEQLSFL